MGRSNDDFREGAYLKSRRKPSKSIRYRLKSKNLSSKVELIRLAKNSTQTEEVHFRSFLEHLGLVFLSIKPEGELIYLSEHVKGILGYSAKDFKDNPELFFSLIHPDDQNKFYNFREARKRLCSKVMEIEYRVRNKQGEYFWIYQRQIPRKQKSSQDIKIYDSVWININEKKNLENQISHTQRMETIGLLTSSIAHDFRNNLSAIIGHLNLALEQLPDEHPAYKNLASAEQAALRSTELTQNLMTLSRKSAHDLETINLNSIIKDTTNLLKPLLKKAARVYVSSDSDESFIHGNYAKLQQVIMNICINAREAMKAGEIYINLCDKKITYDENTLYPNAKEGKYYEVSIRDTGPGIPPEHIKFIFDPYFTTKKGAKKGTGLGLNSAYSTINAHDGFITARNSEYGGAVFSFIIPQAENTCDYEIKEPEVKKEPQNKKILIADDEEMVLASLEAILCNAGYDVTTATDGLEALEIYTTSPDDFSVIILDQTMPRLAGKQVIKKIREISPEKRIILTSGHNLSCSIVKKDPNVTCLEKPFRPMALLKLLEE